MQLWPEGLHLDWACFEGQSGIGKVKNLEQSHICRMSSLLKWGNNGFPSDPDTCDRAGMRRKNLLGRKIMLKNSDPCGDVLLDEALKHIKETNQQETVQVLTTTVAFSFHADLFSCRHGLNICRVRLGTRWSWGTSSRMWGRGLQRTWYYNSENELCVHFEVQVEKGVLTTEKQNFLLFDMTTHPVTDNVQKTKLIKKVQESVLAKWVNDPHRMEKRMLSLIFLAHRCVFYCFDLSAGYLPTLSVPPVLHTNLYVLNIKFIAALTFWRMHLPR